MTTSSPTRAQAIYLSGPMSGVPEHNFPLFERVAKALRPSRIVLSPHEFPNAEKSWEDCLRYDLIWLCQCDAIALLPGWERSAGSLLELAVAETLGCTVYTVAEVHDAISLIKRNSSYPLPPSPASTFTRDLALVSAKASRATSWAEQVSSMIDTRSLSEKGYEV